MIVDKIENIELYFGISAKLKQAFLFIAETDFSTFKAGKHNLGTSEMFLLINDYSTKKNEDNILEAHKKYIDLQFMVNGSEIIEYESLDKQNIKRLYDEKNDYSLFTSQNSSKIKLSKGMFAVFFPKDLHMPGIIDSTSISVRKVVVKILIN